MAETPVRPARSGSLLPTILVAVGVICVLVVGVLVLRGPPNTTSATASKPAVGPTAQPTATQDPLAPSFDVVRVNPSGDTVIAGRAAPGAQVIIRQGGKEIGRATADGRGEWVFLPSEPLPSGARELTLSSRIGDGPEIAGAGSVVLLVPEHLLPGSVAPANLPAAPVAVLSDNTGAPRVLQGPSATGKTPGRLGLEAVEYDEQGQMRFAGTAPPGARVQVHVDNRAAGEAVADARGVWSVVPTGAVTPGAHQLRLDRLGADGRVVEHADYPFQRETVTEKEMAEGNVVVRPGNSLWMLARSRYGQGTRYIVIYEANRARLTDPGKIYPGQILALPPAADLAFPGEAGSAKPGTAPNSSSKSR